MNKGNASTDSHDENEKKGDGHDPDVVPPDLPSAQQKAQERGRWVMEAIIKGTVSGAMREAIREGLEHMGF